MNRRIAFLSCVLALTAGAAAAAEPFDAASARAGDLLASARRDMTAAAANGAAAAAAVPAGYTRRSFRVDATLYSEGALLAQPAVLTMTFDLEDAKNVNREHAIKNLQFRLELLPGGYIRMSPYAMTSPGPESRPDFYPPDPSLGENQLTYAEERGDQTQFYIEARSSVDARAAGSVMEGALTRLDGGRTHGAKTMLKIYPYCTRDLASCRLGDIAGVSYDHWGLGWFNDRVYPEYRLIAEKPFSLTK